EPNNVPGSFHPYNVSARVLTPEEAAEAELESGEKGKKEKDRYTTKGKYHCLVTEYDLDPVVILFARNLDDSAGFKSLLKKLDASIEKNRVRRLRAFVVFLDKEGLGKDKKGNDRELSAEDDKRGEMAKNAEKIEKDCELKNVVLTLAAEKDVAKYGLDDTVAL